MRKDVLEDFKKVTNPQKAEILQRFFKTGKGDYGEGDLFLGIVTPDMRRIIKKYSKTISLEELLPFTSSKYHEHRMFAFLSLTYKPVTKEIYDFYISNLKYVNNWDLVDLTAPNIVGKYLYDKDRSILYTLARSKNLWEQRVSILSTFYFLRQGDFKDTLAIAEILLHHEHDLIHKAVGWMLREVGKKNLITEEEFLKKYYKEMPRTMLRYAIEKFEEEKRQSYLKGTI